MVLLHLHFPSGASLRYAVCHTSCSSYGIRHGSYCVLHATSFITSFVPLHYTSFVAGPFAARQGILADPQSLKQKYAPAFPQAIATILTGFHFASLRHSFTSVAFSPPAAHNLLALRTHFGCVHLATANCSCRTSISQSIAKVHLHSSAASVP